MRALQSCSPLSKEAPVVASSCRRAALAFLEGVSRGWKHADLACWLGDEYAAVTIRLDDDADGPPPESSLTPLKIVELTELVAMSVTEALRNIAIDPVAIVETSIRAGSLIAIQQDDGELWMPVDRPNLDIETRVLSLFATDYLLNPDAYEEELLVCEDCDQVSFDGSGRCPLCTPASWSSAIHFARPNAHALGR